MAMEIPWDWNDERKLFVKWEQVCYYLFKGILKYFQPLKNKTFSNKSFKYF